MLIAAIKNKSSMIKHHLLLAMHMELWYDLDNADKLHHEEIKTGHIFIIVVVWK